MISRAHPKVQLSRSESKRFRNTTLSVDADRRTIGPPIDAAAEASVRQLIASGDPKAALELAKDIHKAFGTTASEVLLVDAYEERIRELVRRDLNREAQSLLDLVRQRYPSARKRLDASMTRSLARAESLDELVRPLNDPALDATSRTAIERALQHEVRDPAALARCSTLPVDHPLRQAASALERALVAATSGPVARDALELPEVSHRGPLAPWKLLVRAIASFYEGDDESCLRYLDAIDLESAPARLAPVIRAMLRGDAPASLTSAAAVLEMRVAGRTTALEGALEALDEAFVSGSKGRILRAIRAAVQTCRQTSPDQLDYLRQLISARCAVIDLDAAKVRAAMDGPSRHDAAFLQLFARAMEETRDPEMMVVACRIGEEFRHTAAVEGWFAANGPEAAALALHIADLLRQVPDDLLRELQHSSRSQARLGGEKMPFLFPGELYQRACALDPHPDAFSQWMEWAAHRGGRQVERVASAWHKIRPKDIEPILQLLKEAEARGAFRPALGYLAKIEQIDSLHPTARGMRLRLLARSALAHLQQEKPALAAGELTAIEALPHAQYGDRPALVAALRYLVYAAQGNGEGAAGCRAEVERLLGCGGAAAMLISAVATAAKRPDDGRLGPVGKLSSAERARLPAALARVATLAADLQLRVQVPGPWLAEVARRFPSNRHTLDVDQLRALGEAALLAGHGELAYAVSAAGLDRGGSTEPRFLLLRACSITEPFTRRVLCARAAAELARRQQDAELAEEAAELVRELFEFAQVSLTVDQAHDVLETEKAEQEPPGRGRPGPDYSHLIPECQCPNCRRRRGEAVDPFTDFDIDEDDEDAKLDFPPDMPPDVAELFLQEARKARRRGESVEAFVARLMAGGPPKRRSRKGKRR